MTVMRCAHVLIRQLCSLRCAVVWLDRGRAAGHGARCRWKMSSTRRDEKVVADQTACSPTSRTSSFHPLIGTVLLPPPCACACACVQPWQQAEAEWDVAMKQHEATSGEKAAKELHARCGYTRQAQMHAESPLGSRTTAQAPSSWMLRMHCFPSLWASAGAFSWKHKQEG